MILYKDWGKHLRFGNFWFVYTSLLTIAKRANHKIALPDYFAWKYLINPPEVDNGYNIDEPIFHFRTHEWSEDEQNWIYQYFKDRPNKNINVNLGSNNQSELWFQDELHHVKEMISFKDSVISSIKDKYLHILKNGKRTIGIGVRRGDFVNHGVFHQIPLEWYIKALEVEFPDWRNCNILVFSDHIEEMRILWQDKDFFFAEPNGTHTHAENFKHYHKDPMEQFILGTLCDDFIIGNSTFSWWQAWYVKNFNGGKVVHSGKNLSELGEKEFGKNTNYYPKDWVLHNTN